MYFKRWKDSPEVQEAVNKLESSSKKYFQLLNSGDKDSKIQALKLWANMSSSYWDILFALVDAQTQSLPEKLFFDSEEKLFIDLGCMPGVLNLSPDFDAQTFFNTKCSGGILPVMTFTDYIAESWAAITGRDVPESSIGMSIDARINYLSRYLDQLQKLRDKELSSIASSFEPNMNASQLSQIMNESLLAYMKVTMRVPEYREGDGASRQKLTQQRKAYLDAEKKMIPCLHLEPKNF